VAKVKVAIELWDEKGESTMRWEHHASLESMGAFLLLGRAFELAQRDTDANFYEALAAFLKDASIQKGDVGEALQRIEER
jgi:hypothetical protein